MRGMRKFLSGFTISAFALVVLAACGDEGNKPRADAAQKLDAATDAPVTTPSCSDYCTKVMANCTATNQQYASMANCTDSCSHFMVGTSGMTAMNTVGCRIYHAELALTDPTTHCAHAGPGGGGQCGNVCGGYCKIAVAACPAQVVEATCSDDCSKYASAGKPYNISIQTGNTAECRLYHATAAATDPGGHCSHVGNNSTRCL